METDPNGERWLVAMVREWVTAEHPEHPDLAAPASAVAQAAYEDGTSLAGARRHAQAFAGCWARHPSHARGDRSAVRLAS
jgi:hypothetical protein